MDDHSQASSVKVLTEAEWGLRREFRDYWCAFGDADWTPEDFGDRMLAAGFAELDDVSDDDLEDAFAYERGIEPGGQVYRLTDLGREVLAAANADTSEASQVPGSTTKQPEVKP